MPVKRRTSKRRLDSRAEMEAWSDVFETEFDFFDSLQDIGVQTDRCGRPDEQTAGAAWARLGAQYLAEHGPRSQSGPTAWALEQFGEPGHAD